MTKWNSRLDRLGENVGQCLRIKPPESGYRQWLSRLRVAINYKFGPGVVRTWRAGKVVFVQRVWKEEGA